MDSIIEVEVFYRLNKMLKLPNTFRIVFQCTGTSCTMHKSSPKPLNFTFF